MIKTQPIKKYIAPAIVATSIAVFSPVLIDEASANGDHDIEETSNTKVNTSSSSESSEAVSGGATLLRNVDVTNLQEQLNENGQDVSVDGINGKDTKKGVEAVQEDNGIQVDGIVGDDTKDALGISTASSSNDESSSSSDSDDSSNDNEEVEATNTGSSNDSGNEEAGEDDLHAPAPMSLGSIEDSALAADGRALGKAQCLLGTPYVFGGDDPATGLDSSGFINAVFSDKGLERTH